MKRVFDVVVAAILLIAFSPLMVCVAALVRLFLGSPVIFRQMRPGLGGQPFQLNKFRTMRVSASPDDPASDRDRLTQFGKVLRASSLDELPELYNVLKGEMSLVGPRPLLMEYLPLYTRHQFRRHEVRPGITGWAQVNGRNAVSWEERLAMDVWYVDNRSFWLDMRILFLTVIMVFKREGISQEGHVTMEKFRGSVG